MKKEDLKIGKTYIVKTGLALDEVGIMQLTSIELECNSPIRVSYTFIPLDDCYYVTKWDSDIEKEVEDL